MTLLRDLIKPRAPAMEFKVERKVEQLEFDDVSKGGNAVDGIARKRIADAIKKGYAKDAAIKYCMSYLKSQPGMESVSACSKVAEKVWKDIQEEPLKEGMADPGQVADELEEMLGQMNDIMDNVKRLLRNAPADIQQHAKGYWVAHIVTALGSDHDYMGGTSKYDTMEATIEKLRAEVDTEA